MQRAQMQSDINTGRYIEHGEFKVNVCYMTIDKVLSNEYSTKTLVSLLVVLVTFVYLTSGMKCICMTITG